MDEQPKVPIRDTEKAIALGTAGAVDAALTEARSQLEGGVVYNPKSGRMALVTRVGLRRSKKGRGKPVPVARLMYIVPPSGRETTITLQSLQDHWKFRRPPEEETIDATSGE